MPIKKITITGILILIVVIFIGCEGKVQPAFQCDDPLGCVDIAPQESINIAALEVISGKVKSIGLEQIRMIELAIANHGGKLLGHPVKLQIFDEMCSKEGGRIGAQQIISNPKIVAVFGTTCSGAAAPAIKILSEAGYAMISGSNTAPSLTSVNGHRGKDHYDGYFRTSHNDEVQGRAAAAFAYQILRQKKAATIHDGDVYTRGLTQVFHDEFERLGGQIVITTAVNKGDTDMQPVLNAVADSGAKLIFFPLFQPEGDYIVKQARKMPAFDNITLMGADGLLQKVFLDSVGNDGKGMYFVGPANPEGAKYNDLIAQFMKKNGSSD
ncbi:MAG: ABC transporter substrate-binding protein [Desulfobacteraceae bacterium]|nr:ABC transporter substrate-binding protein [Desulfobacteraceae bacterium]